MTDKTKPIEPEVLERLEEAAEILERVDGMADHKVRINARIVQERARALLSALEPPGKLRASLARLLAALDELLKEDQP